MNIDLEIYNLGECNLGGNNPKENIAEQAKFRSLYRRSSELTRATLSLVDVIVQCQPDYIVFSSRFGEMKRTTQLLQSIGLKEELSPLQFSQSVHSTAPGLLTIASGLQVPYTTISAGSNSMAMALLEAISRLNIYPEKSVFVIDADEVIPEVYSSVLDHNINERRFSALYLRKGHKYTVEVGSFVNPLNSKDYSSYDLSEEQGGTVLGRHFNVTFTKASYCSEASD